MYGWMVRSFGFIGCLLVGFFGLSQEVFAAFPVDTEEQAFDACSSMSSLNNKTLSTGRVISSKCFKKSLTPTANGTKGAYICIQKSTLGNTGTQGYCTPTGTLSSACNDGDISDNNNLCFDRYDQNYYNATTVQQSLGDVFAFTWLEDTDLCKNKEDFISTTLRANSPNGSGSACYNSCSYTVFVSYVGTYPAGYLEYDFASNKRSCDGSEDPAIDQPIDPSDPLDLPPEDGGVEDTVDPGPGEGEDGKGTSSGGGSCDSPPACSGDAIQCNILYQSWAGRCATEQGFEGVGEGGIGDGSGDIVDAVDGVGSKVDALGDKISDTFGDGSESGDLSGFVSEGDVSADMFDGSGFGFSRSCPIQTSHQITAGPLNFTIDLTVFCTILSWAGYLIVAIGSFLSVYIVMRSQ